MFDVARFLMRWSFLSNLCRDIGEIQLIPPQPYHPPQQYQHSMSGKNQRQHPYMALEEEFHWKDQCLRGVLSYPPGMQRALVLDAMRTELVEELARTNNVEDRGEPPDRQTAAQRFNQPSPLRAYLPQLVSAVLKSPDAFQGDLTDPIQRLRSLLLNKCLTDPSFGIELCWLLEAEVGRTWKKLFEHRQQTGRRLVVVLPAEKAAVLAKIGAEKKEAFDLLQDAEQATAYGDIQGEQDNMRLPSSISLRRCGHFGDTMHFIDQLGIISSRLREVPVQHRNTVMKNSLEELNRRIRRRMITRGEVSLDVEDNMGPFDWPLINDMSLNVIGHSFHLPLVPQTHVWPDGIKNPSGTPPTNEVVRVLNIVVEESRLMSSRERCPMLIHVEVFDSGLEGSDARLYTKATENIGATISEALGVKDLPPISNAETTMQPIEKPTHTIPDELVESADDGLHMRKDETHRATVHRDIPRGGWNEDMAGLQHQNGNMFAGRIYHTGPTVYSSVDVPVQQQSNDLKTEKSIPRISLGNDLLNNVFGLPWTEKCREIREASPYGHVKGWRLASFIMKAGEDIRRESFVMQIISKLRQWFTEELPEAYRPYLRPYSIMCVGGDVGMVECLSNAKSVDEIKKKTDSFVSLRDYFERAYGYRRPTTQTLEAKVQEMMNGPMPNNADVSTRPGPQSTPFGKHISFETAQENFLKSLVGYSLLCFILQVKDRHNANLLMDRLGHIIHIDFGYVLGDTPKMGKVPLFSERAPFKLSAEIWEVLGGWKGLGVKFCQMFELAFAVASRHADEIVTLTESVMLSMDSDPRHAKAVANGVRSRLRMRGPAGSREQKLFVADLVNAALSCWGTSTYDWLQRNMNGYL